MKFRRRLNVLKKQTSRLKHNKISAQPVHHNFVSKYKLFCCGFIKIHYTFCCDLQNIFKENAKEIRYCNTKLNVISDVLRDEEGWLSKTKTNCI